MQIYKIMKGNFALENTRDIRQHENNLRFHIKIEDKYYEYAIDNINKNTINVRCVIGKQKFRQKCYARLTLTVAGYLKTERKASNSKTPKWKWAESNIETDYFDLRSFSIQTHKCTKNCLKGCILKHSCAGHVVSRDRKRRHLDEARNYSIEFYTESTASAVKHADNKVGFGKPNAVEKEKPLSGVNDAAVKRSCRYDRNNWIEEMKFKPWSELKIPIDKDITKYRVEKFHHKFDDMEIFTLPSELILLNRFKTYADGTFRTINSCFLPKTKEKIFKQNYIVTIKWEYQDAVFAYPIIYCLMKRRRKIDYINF